VAIAADPADRRGVARAAALAPLLLVACATMVTPRAIVESDWPEDERRELIGRWSAAVTLANAFLASEANASLPRSLSYSLDRGTGMTLHCTCGAFRPVHVANSWWGDLCVWSGFAAQERSWGFVVGDRGDGPQAVGHSMFYYSWGPMKASEDIAELILHETAHMVHGVGTVGFLAGIGYYWNTMFHGGGREHPAELLPYSTSDEFLQWLQTR